MAVIKIVPMPGAVGDKGDEGAVGPQGQQGPAGQNGLPGADGVTPFTIVGEYSNGADYGYGAAVYYNGGTYVRTGNPNNPGYPPAVGSVNASWTPLAEKGSDGNSADIADFVFTLSGNAPFVTNSTMSITDHDMRIQTIKTSAEVVDADISVVSADNITMNAQAHISLNGFAGEFLKDHLVPENQIATIGDLPTGATGTFESADSKLITVTNGIITSIESLT